MKIVSWGRKTAPPRWKANALVYFLRDCYESKPLLLHFGLDQPCLGSLRKTQICLLELARFWLPLRWGRAVPTRKVSWWYLLAESKSFRRELPVQLNCASPASMSHCKLWVPPLQLWISRDTPSNFAHKLVRKADEAAQQPALQWVYDRAGVVAGRRGGRGGRALWVETMNWFLIRILP